MSNYPQAFTNTCLCGSSCNNNICKCTNSTCKCSKNKQREPYFTTTHCQPFSPIMNIIQDNKVDFSNDTKHNWSNQRGYGNIVVSTADNCNNVVGRVAPYNRIPTLSLPTSSNIDPQYAWSNKKHC